MRMEDEKKKDGPKGTSASPSTLGHQIQLDDTLLPTDMDRYRRLLFKQFQKKEKDIKKKKKDDEGYQRSPDVWRMCGRKRVVMMMMMVICSADMGDGRGGRDD